MAKRPVFQTNHFYHVYNRGVDKRIIFQDKKDYLRFKEICMKLNTQKASGGVYVLSFEKRREVFDDQNPGKLVEIISYNLLPNHFHLLLQEKVEGGISKFMQKISTGYTVYFNEKYERSGSLFQGVFKASEIQTNIHGQHIFAYINHNHTIHGIENTNLIYSSILEFTNKLPNKAHYLANYTPIQPFLGNLETLISTLDTHLQKSIQIKQEKRRGTGVWLE